MYIRLAGIYTNGILEYHRIKNNKSYYDISIEITECLKNQITITEKMIWEPCGNSKEKRARAILCDCLNFASKNDTENQKISTEQLLNYLEKNYKFCTFDFLALVETLIASIGDFKATISIRNGFNKKLDKMKKIFKVMPARYYMDYYFYLLSEKRDKLDDFIKFLKKYKNLNFEIQNYLSILNKSVSRIVINKKDEDKDYLNFIKNKKIVIIGPGDYKVNIEELKNKFDILVNFNYKIDNTFIPTITYYNGPISNTIVKDDSFPEIVNRLDKVLLKYEPDNLSEMNKSKIRTYWHCYKLFPKGSPNMVQAILYDLLCFNPKCIKIINVDFYTKKNMYKKGYGKDLEDKKDFTLLQSFALHNMKMQFLLTQDLFINNCIEFDDIGTQCMKLTLNEYVDLLQENRSQY